ncbi:MAG: GNAT family N-acetyltransferase [Treponema sp.]|nr:GNAT family N-acetyltransferase [Treponema sp.]
MNELTVRKAVAGDASEILNLFKIIGGESDNLSFDENGLSRSEEEEREYLRSREDLNSEAFFVAKLGAEIVGTAHYTACSGKRMSHKGSFGLCVRKSAWGKGVGKALMQAILDFARNSAKSDIVFLEVRCDNERAISLYERFGFEKIGCFKGFFKIDGKLIDFYIMEKFLNS